MVDRLRAKGLLTTVPDPNDKRRSIISLTDRGAAMMQHLYQAGARITAETLAPLNATEQKTLLSLIKKIGEG